EQSDPPYLRAWVELGAGGQTIARAITSSRDCPYIKLDETVKKMLLRAVAETIPPRTNTAGIFKASAFPVTTCECLIPPGTHVAKVSATFRDDSDDPIKLPRTHVATVSDQHLGLFSFADRTPGNSVFAHCAMVSATCASAPVYMWSAFAIRT